MKPSKLLKKARKIYLANPNPASYVSYFGPSHSVCPRAAVVVAFTGREPDGRVLYAYASEAEVDACAPYWDLLNAAASFYDPTVSGIDGFGKNPRLADKIYKRAIKAAKDAEAAHEVSAAVVLNTATTLVKN